MFICVGYDPDMPGTIKEELVLDISDGPSLRIAPADVSVDILEIVNGYLKSICGLRSQGTHYENKCWSCQGDISSKDDYACECCGWYVCKFDDACGCDYQGPITSSRKKSLSTEIRLNRKRYHRLIMYLHNMTLEGFRKHLKR